MKSTPYICILILACFGCKSPDIEKIRLAELDGSKIDLSGFKGKTVFVHVWATWCGPCIKEMPTIDKAQGLLSDDNVEFLFASNEDAEEINDFIKSRSFNFHYVRLLNFEELGIPALPTTYIFDQNGELMFSETGTRDWTRPDNLKLISQSTEDNGIEEIPVPTANASAEPFLFENDGTTFLTWVEKGDSGSTLRMSKLNGMQWTPPVEIATGNSWFVNWADYPMATSKGQNMIAHFLDKSGDGKYAYDVKLILSGDGGNTWQQPMVLNDDRKEAEHGFVTLLPYGNNFFITWLDGRNTVMEGHEGHHGSMSLRAAVIDYSGKKINEWQLDDKTCDCCQTTAAITSSGPVVIYRDRSDDEIRDMSIVRLVDGQWTSSKPVHNDNWKIAGCPVNGPRVSSKGNTLAVAWFSAADEVPKVQVAFSDDAGASFHEPIRIDEEKTIGRVDIEMIDELNALVTWMEGADIKIMKVSKDGTKGPSSVLASSSDSRASGFPQLVISDGRAIVAWTDDKEKKVRTATAALSF